MLRLGKIRKFLLVLGFLAMVAVGYVASSVYTSCPANAQLCNCNICTVGLSATLGQVGSSIIVPGIAAAGAAILAYYALASTALSLQVSERFAITTQKFISTFETFWNYGVRPAMQNQTVQLNVADVDQATRWSSFVDGMDASRKQRLEMMDEVDTHREMRPGENVCVAGTVMGGMQRAATFSKKYNSLAPAERAQRSSGTTGTAAASGPAADQNERFQTYRTRYCDPNANGGRAGCTGTTPYMGLDMDVTGQIFKKDTIDISDPNVQQTIDDLIINIAEPFVKDPVKVGVMNSAAGRQAVLEERAYKAKRQVIHDALYFLVSRRTPGSQMREFIEPIRLAAGVPSSEISQNPSRNEVMEVMMSERFRTGSYSIDQIDEPENNERELVIQQAFQVMRMNDQLDLLDKYSMILAADLGHQVQQDTPLYTSREAQPFR